ncbi:MAG: 2-oxoglutarate dehydrogenase, partial [Gammaproteobacteria bacterium]|nr:2-oxoglutarate dehydrogenase [Gammaproteobacteria bacterium]
MKRSEEGMEQQWQSSQLFGGNSDYLEALYESYLHDPNSVDVSWQNYFANITVSSKQEPIHSEIRQHFIKLAKHPVLGQVISSSDPGKSLAVYELIEAYRARAHRKAKIDPLNMMQAPALPELDLNALGLGASLNQEFS